MDGDEGSAVQLEEKLSLGVLVFFINHASYKKKLLSLVNEAIRRSHPQ